MKKLIVLAVLAALSFCAEANAQNLLLHSGKAPTPPASGGPTPVLWLDASNTGSITASGSSVTQINDLSGSGFNFTQGNLSNSPLTGTATQNGLNLLDYTALLAWVSNTTIAVAQPFTVFEVTKSALSGIVAQFHTDSDTGNNRIITINTTGNGGNMEMFAGGSANLGDTTTIGSGFFVGAYVFNGNSSQIYYNASLNGTGGGGIPGSDNITNGDGLRIGQRFADSGQSFGGYLAEYRIYSGALSGADISTITTALRTKWGF